MACSVKRKVLWYCKIECVSGETGRQFIQLACRLLFSPEEIGRPFLSSLNLSSDFPPSQVNLALVHFLHKARRFITKKNKGKTKLLLTIAAYFAFFWTVNFQPVFMAVGLGVVIADGIVVTPCFCGEYERV